MKITIKGAKIIDPESTHHNKVKNITIKDGQITAIGGQEEGDIIEAKGMLLTPGWFDMRAHFNDPGGEHKETLQSGLKAATAGGFTGVALLPNTNPPVDTKNDIKYLSGNNNRSVTKIYPYGAVTKECKGEELTEMIDLTYAGAAAFTDGNRPIWNTDIVLKTLQYLQPYGKLLINKPEDKYLNMFGQMHEGKISTMLGMKGMPEVGEEIMVRRDLELLAYAGGKIHFSTISTSGAVKMIKKAKKDGLQVSCDLAIYQPLWIDSDLEEYDTNLKVNPPFRNAAINKKLIKGLHEGIIDVLVSNHQPQDTESKNLEFDLADFGMISIQTFGAHLVELSRELSWEVLIKAITHNPRNLLGVPKPVVDEGSTAELTLLDPKEKWIFDKNNNFSKSHNSPYLGTELQGKVKAVFNQGLSWMDI